MLLWLAPKGLVLPTVPTRTTQIRMALLDKVDAPVVVEPAAVALNELLRNSASGGVEVAKIVPGRKGATFIDSLDELPDKGKVQLWSSRDAAPSG